MLILFLCLVFSIMPIWGIIFIYLLQKAFPDLR